MLEEMMKLNLGWKDYVKRLFEELEKLKEEKAELEDRINDLEMKDIWERHL